MDMCGTCDMHCVLTLRFMFELFESVPKSKALDGMGRVEDDRENELKAKANEKDGPPSLSLSPAAVNNRRAHFGSPHPLT